MALISNVVTGGTIAASWGNAVRDQGVQVCTSSTRPTSPSEGMMIYETDTDKHLVYDGSAWQWLLSSKRVGCTVRQTTAQSITSNSLQSQTFQTEDYDSDGFITAPSGTITIPTGLDGMYSIAYAQYWASNPNTAGYAVIKVNIGGTIRAFTTSAPGNSVGMPGNGTNFLLGVTAVVPLSGGDSMTFQAYQNSGGSINLTSVVNVYRIGS
jgi:hypothetical protein